MASPSPLPATDNEQEYARGRYAGYPVDEELIGA